jgi:LuxR family transcriptional regulator, maltose regulon positive regulatory protein
MNYSLLLSKLHIPLLQPHLIDRPHLIDQLERGIVANHRLTLLSAVAGAGKTTLLAQWAHARSANVTWLSLDEADNDPARFAHYLIAALQVAHPTVGQQALDDLATATLQELPHLLTSLLNDFTAVSDAFVLVLDDYHLIDAPPVHEIVLFLLERLPAQLHLAIATRADPPLPLPRLRASRQLTELRAPALRFRDGEVSTFFDKILRVPLPADAVQVLTAKTEGWIAGLQLAALSLQRRANPLEFVRSFAGTDQYILEYLTQEVLDNLPAEILSFLLRTSILRRLSAPLCDAVTGGTTSHEALVALREANLFLIPLDSRQEWYRYHPLFADLLQAELRRRLAPGEVARLYHRASAWHRDHDTLEEAIEYALALPDVALAVTLVEAAGMEMILEGRLSTLERWLSRLPNAEIAARPRLRLFGSWVAYIGATEGRGTEELEAARASIGPLEDDAEWRMHYGETSVLLSRAAATQGRTRRARARAEEALATLPAGQDAARAGAMIAEATALHLEGETALAQARLREAGVLARRGDNLRVVAHQHLIDGAIYLHQGQLETAARAFHRLLALRAHLAASDHGAFLLALGYLGCAAILVEQNHLERATGWLQRAQAVSEESMTLVDTSYLAGIVRARLQWAKGAPDATARSIHQASLHFFGRLSPLADMELAALATRLHLALGDDAGAARWLDSVSQAGLPRLYEEMRRVAQAQWYVARGELEMAEELCEQVRSSAQEGGRVARLVEVELIMTHSLARQGGPAEALRPLRRALEAALPGGYVRRFLEEGPVILRLLDQLVREASLPPRLRGYALRLLASAEGEASPAGPRPAGAPGQPLIEPLTERELEVLHLIAAGHSNAEIAAHLMVTVYTVKKHASNIYGKLGVQRRTQALARARELALL